MKMFIPGSYDIRLLCSNMRIKDNNASFDMELKNQHFVTHVNIQKENSKLEDGVHKST